MVTFHNPPRRKRPSFGSPLPNRQVCLWQRWFILLFLLFRKHCIHGLLINPSLCTSGRPLQPAWVRLGLRSCFFLVSGFSSFYASSPRQVFSSFPLSESMKISFGPVFLVPISDFLTQSERGCVPRSLTRLSRPCLNVGLTSTTLDAMLGKGSKGLFNQCLPSPWWCWTRSTRPPHSREPSTLLLTYVFIQTIPAIGHSQSNAILSVSSS